MTTPTLVSDFYRRIWNTGNRLAVDELLAEDFAFRGSLGVELRGRARFWEYVCEIQSVLEGFRCDVLECVSEGQMAFAKMKFSGAHVGELRGFRASGLPVQWLGAALFYFESDRIRELWVLGDLVALDAMLARPSGV
jgi:predicted ester cyclase